MLGSMNAPSSYPHAASVAVPSAQSNHGAGLFWGALGVLAFSVSLPATRLAIAGGLPASFVGIGRAVVAGLLALATLALLRQPCWRRIRRMNLRRR